MDRVPTYQDITRARAEREAAQNQMAQRDALVNEAQARVTPNPVLAEYMSRGAQPAQQGLIPRENPADNYAMFATNVADNVEDQETYSMTMIGAAAQGQVPIEAVLEDENILPQFKQGLLEAVSANKPNPGLGQIR